MTAVDRRPDVVTVTIESPPVPIACATEQHRPARSRGPLTVRAARWAIEQIGSEHASIQDVTRQFGVRW